MVSLQRENAKAATETAAATLPPPAARGSWLHTHKHGKTEWYTTSQYHVKKQTYCSKTKWVQAPTSIYCSS